MQIQSLLMDKIQINANSTSSIKAKNKQKNLEEYIQSKIRNLGLEATRSAPKDLLFNPALAKTLVLKELLRSANSEKEVDDKLDSVMSPLSNLSVSFNALEKKLKNGERVFKKSTENLDGQLKKFLELFELKENRDRVSSVIEPKVDQLKQQIVKRADEQEKEKAAKRSPLELPEKSKKASKEKMSARKKIALVAALAAGATGGYLGLDALQTEEGHTGTAHSVKSSSNDQSLPNAAKDSFQLPDGFSFKQMDSTEVAAIQYESSLKNIDGLLNFAAGNYANRVITSHHFLELFRTKQELPLDSSDNYKILDTLATSLSLGAIDPVDKKDLAQYFTDFLKTEQISADQIGICSLIMQRLSEIGALSLEQYVDSGIARLIEDFSYKGLLNPLEQDSLVSTVRGTFSELQDQGAYGINEFIKVYNALYGARLSKDQAKKFLDAKPEDKDAPPMLLDKKFPHLVNLTMTSLLSTR